MLWLELYNEEDEEQVWTKIKSAPLLFYLVIRARVRAQKYVIVCGDTYYVPFRRRFPVIDARLWLGCQWSQSEDSEPHFPRQRVKE
jgi:hypothetical protein